MNRGRRRPSWLCPVLFVLGVTFLGLSAWRFMVFWSGPEEAFLHFEPSPLLAENDRLAARFEELDRRWRAGDPTVTFDDVDNAWLAHADHYAKLDQDHTARWQAAQYIELCIWLPGGLLGGILVLAATGWFLVIRLSANRN